jgi:hypothetical protein
MDRKSWIAITLSVAGLFAWQWYVSKYYKPQLAKANAATVSATPAPTATPAVNSTPGWRIQPRMWGVDLVYSM